MLRSKNEKALDFQHANSECLGAWLLFGVSAIGCSCEEPWNDFLHSFKVEDAYDYENLDDKIINENANKNLIGKNISEFNYPYGIPYDCLKVGDNNLTCNFWVFSGVLRDKGFHVSFHIDEHGKLLEINVSDIQRLFGFLKV